MFNQGDWVYGIDEYKDERFLTYAFVVASIGRFYICTEQINKEDESKNVKDIIESIYERYRYNGDFRDSEIVMLKKENTFATEQEAREVLKVMKNESNV